jgi:hypothetical protein
MDGREGQEPTDATARQAGAAPAGAEAVERGPGTRSADARAQGTGQSSDRLEPAEGSEQTLTRADVLRISLLRNIRYHEDREGYFGWTNRMMSLIVLFTGTASFAAFQSTSPSFKEWAPWIGVLTSLIGGLQLVNRRAALEHQHGTLRKQFLGLHAEVKDDDVSVDLVRSKAAQLYKDEPPTYCACDAIAFNAAMRAHERRTFLQVSPRARLLRHICRFAHTRFPERVMMLTQETFTERIQRAWHVIRGPR